MSTPEITIDSLTAALDTLYTNYSATLNKLDLDAPLAAPGDWTPRQVLSHGIGSLNRTPIQGGCFLAGVSMVPVVFSDPYWISLWATAPREGFAAALLSEVEGNKAFVRSLTPANLLKVVPVFGLGTLPLGVFLQISYKVHVHEQHLPQLQAYLK